MRPALLLALVCLTPALLFCDAFGSNDADEQPPSPTVDASDSGATEDAPITSDGDNGIPKTKCAWDAKFVRTKLLKTISSNLPDRGLALSDDELEVFFSTNFDHISKDASSPNVGIFRADRKSLNDPFGNITFRPDLGIGSFDPTVTADRLSIYFVKEESPPGSNKYDLYVATRPNNTSDFGDAGVVSNVNADAAIDFLPAVSPLGDELFFTSDRSGIFTVWHAVSTGNGFRAASEVMGLTQAKQQTLGSPALSHDRLGLYYTIALDQTGKKEVWRARRNTVNEEFKDATLAPELNGFNQNPTWLSVDECRLYSFENHNEVGYVDFYVFERDL